MILGAEPKNQVIWIIRCKVMAPNKSSRTMVMTCFLTNIYDHKKMPAQLQNVDFGQIGQPTHMEYMTNFPKINFLKSKFIQVFGITSWFLDQNSPKDQMEIQERTNLASFAPPTNYKLTTHICRHLVIYTVKMWIYWTLRGDCRCLK